MPEPTVVSEFELGKRGFVRVSVSQFHGQRYADLRLWVEPRDQPGAPLLPTKKGLALPIEYLGELREALQALADQVAQPVPRRRAGG